MILFAIIDLVISAAFVIVVIYCAWQIARRVIDVGRTYGAGKKALRSDEPR